MPVAVQVPSVDVMQSRQLAALAATGVFLVGVAGCGIGGGGTKDSKSFDAPDQKLVIETDNGDVKITRGAKGSKVEVDRQVRGSDATWEMSGDTLILKTPCGFGAVNCGGDYTVAVPEGLALEVKSDNGDVEANGFEGEIAVNNQNGDVTLEGVTNTVRAESTNGGIEIRTTKPVTSIDTHSTNGDITIEVAGGDAKYRIETETTNGEKDVALQSDESAKQSIKAITTNGDIQIK